MNLESENLPAMVYYEDSKPGNRVGICLRVNALRDDPAFGPIIKRYEGSFPRLVERAVIAERDALKGRVFVELWISSHRTRMAINRKMMKAKGDEPGMVVGDYKVIVVYAMENPKWACESDVGRGLGRR